MPLGRTRNQQILDLSLDRIEILSPTGLIEASNDSAKVYFAHRNFDLHGLAWVELWPAQAQERAQQALAEAAAGRSNRFRGEMVGPDGARHCWQSTLSPLSDGDGNLEAIVALNRDITERLEVESAYRLLTQTLRTDLNNLARARAEERAQNFTLQDQLDISRVTAESVLSSTDHLRWRLAEVEGRLARGESREIAIQQELDFAMTARSLAEQATRQAQKGAAIGQLVAGVAHDFNNMLQTMQMGLDALDLSGDNLTPRQRKMLGVSLSAVRHATELTRRLLAFSREHPYEAAEINLVEVIGDMVPLIQHTLGSSVRIEHEVPQTSIDIFADRHSIEQALMNLCVNARDAAKDRGCVIRIAYGTYRISKEDATPEASAGLYHAMDVQDDGEGMGAATMERIFEPFFTTKPEGKGTGLGMAQVFGMMRQAHGFIRVTSEVGVGTTVRLMFPVLG
ncbi:MAG: ATP-binding protein [Pseudoxanthomonas sp.]